MQRYRTSIVVLCYLSCSVVCQFDSAFGQAKAEEIASSAIEVIGYDQVRPILRNRCVTCHNPEEMRGDLDLSDLLAITSGSGSGAVVIPGQPNQSLLYTTAAHLEDPRMPPNRPRIPARELDLIRQWIAGGLAESSGLTSSTMIGEIGDQPSVSKANDPDPSVEQPGPSAEKSNQLAKIRPLFHAAAITVLDVHPLDGLAVIGGRGQACLIDLEDGRFIGGLDFPNGDVTAARFSADGRLLFVAGGAAGLSGKVVAFDVQTGIQVFECLDENDSILALDISFDGRWLAVGGPSKVVRIVETASGKILHTLRKHTDWVISLRFSPDGLLLASGDRFGNLFVWDAAIGELFHTLRGHVDAVHSFAWDVTSEKLLSSGEDGTVRHWDMHHGEEINSWKAADRGILALARDDRRVYTGDRVGALKAWSISTGTEVCFEHAEPIECVAVAPKHGRLIAGDSAGNLFIFTAESLQLEHRLTLPIDPQGLNTLLMELSVRESEYQQMLAENPRVSTTSMDSTSPSEMGETIVPMQATTGDLRIDLPRAKLVVSEQAEFLKLSLALAQESAEKLDETISGIEQTLNQLRRQRLWIEGQIQSQGLMLRLVQAHAESVAEMARTSQQIVIDEDETK